MSLNGWLQSAVLFAVVLALMRPLGIYIARVLEGEKTFLDPVLRPVERLIYRISGIDALLEMNWREYAVAMLLFSFVSLLLTYVIERAAAFPAVEPARPRRRRARSGMEHRRLVHHQYQLAIVCARSGDELLHRDGGARVSQLPERGGRHRRRHRTRPRHRPQAIADHRQLLGRCDTDDPLASAAHLPDRFADSDPAGCSAKPEALHSRHAAGEISDARKRSARARSPRRK